MKVFRLDKKIWSWPLIKKIHASEEYLKEIYA
jgi:hypothetical protein